MKLHLLVAGAAFGLALAGSASAAVTVLGDTSAEECSRAAFHEQGNMDAVKACTRALDGGVLGRRDVAGTYVNRGVIYLVRGEFASARSDFDHAIRTDPQLGEGWVNRGAVNILDRRYQDGINDISKGLTLGTEEPAKAYYNRAVAYEGIDDEKSAYLDYEQATVLEPNWELPKQELARFTVSHKPEAATP
jgi:tetratricopeptide (TPR) repeat protein